MAFVDLPCTEIRLVQTLKRKKILAFIFCSLHLTILSAINHSYCQEKNKAGKKEIFSGYFLFGIRPHDSYDHILTTLNFRIC